MRVTRSKKSIAGLAAGAATLGLGLLGPATPVAMSVAGASAAGDLCVSAPADARQRGGGDGTDPNSVTRAQSMAMEQQLQAGVQSLSRHTRKQARQLVTGKQSFRGRGHAKLTKLFRVNTYVHVITKSDGTGDVTNAQIRDQLDVINDSFAGQTSRRAAWSPFKFVLKKVDRTANDDWYDWGYPGDEETPPTDTDDLEAKTALHRGGWADLNIYIAALEFPLLGYATFPGDDADLTLDGLVLLNDSLPGGSAAPFNEGDTATHEIGHWLYLFHTFENGCQFPGDEVADTPYQDDGDNIFSCDESLDTCAQPGRDPVHNFMSYGDDPCLDAFTPGQSLRMTLAWLVFRAGR
jgi:hypothetical protein